MMKRTTTDRPGNSPAYEASVKHARIDGARATEARAQATVTAPAPSMAEKRSLLVILGSRKEIAAGEFSGPLGEICFHWQLPLDVTIKIASLLKLPSEWKGLILSGRQGYLSVDAAHPGRRFPGLTAELPDLCPSTKKIGADDIRKFLHKLAPDGIYNEALLTGLSYEARLATNFAVLCWSEHKVITKDLPTVRALIIDNLEALKKIRGASNFEDDVHAVLPLLRSGPSKKVQAKYRTQFEMENLQRLSEKKLITMSAAFMLEIHKASFRYHQLPLNEGPYNEGSFKANAIRSFNNAELATLAAIGDDHAEYELTARLMAMPLEERGESICDIYCAIQLALEQGHLSLPAPNRTLRQVANLVWKCVCLMKDSSFDDNLMRASIKTISSTYRYTEKLWMASPRGRSAHFGTALPETQELFRHIRQWINTLPDADAKLVLEELPAPFREMHSGALN